MGMGWGQNTVAWAVSCQLHKTLQTQNFQKDTLSTEIHQSISLYPMKQTANVRFCSDYININFVTCKFIQQNFVLEGPGFLLAFIPHPLTYSRSLISVGMYTYPPSPSHIHNTIKIKVMNWKFLVDFPEEDNFFDFLFALQVLSEKRSTRKGQLLSRANSFHAK